MSGPPPQAGSRRPASVSAPATVRALLDELVSLDGELDAFCVDYFPAAYQEFSSGMPRSVKINILINQNKNDLNSILDKLSLFRPTHRERIGELQFKEAAQRDLKIESRTELSIKIIAIFSLVALLFLVFRYLPPASCSTTRSAATRPALHGEVRWVVRTQPAGARVIDLQSGNVLGTTPVVLALPQSRGVMHLKLDRAEYWSKTIDISLEHDGELDVPLAPISNIPIDLL